MTELVRPDSFEAMFDKYGPAYRWFVTITAMTGTIASVLSSTIINVALPDIMGAMGMGQDKAQLLSAGFLATMTGTMLLCAWLVEVIGYRATFTITLLTFIAGSILGGLAPAESVMIAARIIQGAAAGVLQPLAMLVIVQVFPVNRRGSAMGIYGIGVVLAPALGPALGGLMVDNFSWRYVFFLAIPICAIGLLLGSLFLPRRTTTGPARRFDWIGFALVALFLFELLNALSNGQRHGWHSDAIFIDFLIAGFAGAGFIAWQLRNPTPLLNLRLFKIRSFAGAAAVTFIFGAGIYGSTYVVPLFVQSIQGYTPTRSGLLLMPAGIILAVVFPLAGRLSDRSPPYLTVMLGMSIFGLSSFLMSGADTNTPFWQFAWWILVGRIGLGLVMPSLNAAALAGLPLQLLGQASGAINFVRQLGGALGVNLLSIVLERRAQLYVQSFTDSQNAANSTTYELLRYGGGLYAQAGIPDTLQQYAAMEYLGRMIVSQGSMMGFRDAFLGLAVMYLLALLPSMGMRQSIKK